MYSIISAPVYVLRVCILKVLHTCSEIINRVQFFILTCTCTQTCTCTINIYMHMTHTQSDIHTHTSHRSSATSRPRAQPYSALSAYQQYQHPYAH